MNDFCRISIVLITLVPTMAINAQQVVTLTGDPWPPYLIGEVGEDATKGAGVELAKLVFSYIDGVDVRLPLQPWRRALLEVQQGTKDGIFMLLKTPEREQFMVYTDEIYRSSELIWYSKERFPQGLHWINLHDLATYSIGIVRGNSYGNHVDQAIETGSLSVTEVVSDEVLFRMLATDRIDLAFSTEHVGDAITVKYDQITSSAKPLSENIYYIAFGKKSPARELIGTINHIIANLKAEGTIEKLILE